MPPTLHNTHVVIELSVDMRVRESVCQPMTRRLQFAYLKRISCEAYGSSAG